MEVVHHEASHYLLRWWPSALRSEHQRLKEEVEALKVRAAGTGSGVVHEVVRYSRRCGTVGGAVRCGT